MSGNGASGEAERSRRGTGWLKAHAQALGLVVGGLVLVAADLVAGFGVESMLDAVAARAEFHDQVAAGRRLHIAMLEAEDLWHHVMVTGSADDIDLAAAALAATRGQRDEFAARVGSVPAVRSQVDEVLPIIDSRLAQMEATAAARPSMGGQAAALIVAETAAEDAIGRISEILAFVASDLETRWDAADRSVDRAGLVLRAVVPGATIFGFAMLGGVALAGLREARSRRRAHALLQEREAYNRGLIEASLDALVTVDPDLVITDVNAALCRMWGRSREEVVGSSFPAYFTDPAAAAAGVRAALERGSVADYEIALRARAGPEVLLSFDAATYRDPASGEVRGIIAAARDVTEARRLARSLADQQAYNRGLIEASVDALATIDLRGRIADVNRQMEALTATSREELIGRPFEEVFTDTPAARQGVARVLEEGRVTDYGLVVRGRDGRETPVSYNATTYYDSDAKLQGVLATARDVTARERALQQANASLEAFAYSVSHDLRAPLRAMSGFARALSEDYGAQLDERARDYADRVQRASERMSRLIDDLLSLSHLARVELRFEAVDLSRLAQNVAAELRQQEPGRPATFHIEEGLSVWADPRLIRTVLENLIGNAWKFTGTRPEAIIEVAGLAAEPGWQTVSVKDNGVGFDAAYQDRLFRPFERLHTAAEFPGSGIGLASVARVIERHGGRVWAGCAPGGGAMFCFTLREKEVRA